MAIPKINKTKKRTTIVTTMLLLFELTLTNYKEKIF